MFLRFFFVAVFALCGFSAAIAKDFSARVVDDLGRPVEGVSISVYWIRTRSDGDAEAVELGKTVTDLNGKAQGSYRKEALPKGRDLWVELNKPGYSGYSMAGLQKRFTLKREFRPKDLNEIASYNPIDLQRELKELLAGRFEGPDLAKQIFVQESKFRPALRRLVKDPKVGKSAMWPLAFIGEPEDVRWIIENAPPAKREIFEDRWAYAVVSALTEPTTGKEWEFLAKAASDDYDDGWVDYGAIQALKLIGTPKSALVLEQARKKNRDQARTIDEALAYVRSNPALLVDKDVLALAERVASIVRIGKWKGNSTPVFNDAKDKAYVDITFYSGRDRLTYTATFHKQEDLWKFRGVRETMQALMARETE